MPSFPICQWRGTVFIKIWWQVLIVAIYSSVIVFLHKNIPQMKVTIPWTLVPILGVATGMLLVFRTNTAYDRYWEARKIWSSMTTAIRNLTRNIWVGVKEPEGEDSKVLVEKISALNILAAFSYATRNYLRSEYSYEDADLKYLLRHVPKFYNIDSYEEETPTHIPLELSYLLGAYIKNANGRNLVDPSLLAALNSALNSLVDCLTGFERILRTPIPLAYSVHLHHATWIYIMTLPNQLVEALLWFTPVATCLAAFCLLGVLEIGWEIENPFGKDSNDLPLDDFCRVTHREIQRIMGQKIPSTDVWLMSPANRPLAPDCVMNAPDLARLPPDDLRKLMKRDPKQLRKYFENLAFTPDDPVEKESVKKDTSPPASSPPPPTSQASESAPGTPKKSQSTSVTVETKEAEEEEEEDSELNSKRVSFILPDDEENEEEEEQPEVEGDDADEEEEEEEDEEEENNGQDKNSSKSTEKTEEADKSH